MCLSPVQIYNPSKYISLHHGDPFRLVVPCNHCSECMSMQRIVWHFRMSQEFKHHLSNGGYVLFDTLTYKNSDLPHVSDFIETPVDFPCFNRVHIRKFIVRLRRRLSYRKYSNIRYFLCSEYGVDDKYSHRPHYHILVFANSDIPPFELSKEIYLAWQHGRTDVYSNILDLGMSYLNERVFNDYSLHGMRLANYVAKYVQKDSEFQSKLDARIQVVLDSKFPDGSPASQADRFSFKVMLLNLMSQFHLQSKGFGLQYLSSSEFNLDEVMSTGMVTMVTPDNLEIFRSIPIPMYYQRHLFQEQVNLDGKRFWQLNELGKEFRKVSESRKHHYFVKHLSEWLMNVPSRFDEKESQIILDSFGDVDLSELGYYVLFQRGRFFSSPDYATLSEKYLDCQFYHYGSRSDAIVFDKKFVSPVWLGNDVLGYDMHPVDDDSLFPDYSILPADVNMYTRKDFADSFTYTNSRFEYLYQVYLTATRKLSSKKQSAFDLVQKLEKLYKQMFARV